ncbi:MAG: hypothetical protein B6245_20390 [Desulfobacteraceae bacterium 4572_88]|nr:MAG: hypothetical protein B6245_20390 [Desulfobacteraceae bacterium 4572_88]
MLNLPFNIRVSQSEYFYENRKKFFKAGSDQNGIKHNILNLLDFVPQPNLPGTQIYFFKSYIRLKIWNPQALSHNMNIKNFYQQ